jgi:predicted dehydrogenase
MYGEKPLARSIREGRAICDAVERHGRIWQTGSQQRSQGNFRRAAELVRNGRLGKIEKVEVGLPTGKGTGSQPEQPVPEGLDWEFWLGPAPWAPYTERRCHWNWRWILDYSGGQLTDWAGHHIDIAHWGLGLTHTGPVEVDAWGEYPSGGLWTAPTRYHLACRYANGITINVADRSQYEQGSRWYGEKGWIFVSRRKIDAEPKALLGEVIGPEETRLYVSNNHHQNFLDCVKSRKPTVAPPDQALRSISVALLGEISMMTGRKIKWDPAREEIIGDPGASALLSRTYREPWHY